MIKSVIEIYCILFDKNSKKYQVLSEHSENFIVLSAEIKDNTKDIYSIIANLTEKHISLSADYIKFIHLEPRIHDNKIILSYFCLIPYDIELKDCYKHYTENLINDFPILRKITNMA